MKREARAILRVIRYRQRRPLKICEIAALISRSVRSTKDHLKQMEKAGYLLVDRSEKPHAYEITPKAYAILSIEDACDHRLSST